MYRKFLLVVAMLYGSILAISQKAIQDIVYLKNGSMIRGQLKSEQSSSVNLETNDGSIWVFQRSEIDSIKKDVFLQKKINFTPKGYYNVSSFALLAGRTEQRNLPFNPSLKVINGFQFNSKNGLGIATALESFNYAAFFHSSLDYRHYLKVDRTAPYVSSYAGYSVPFSSYRDWENVKKLGGINGGVATGLRHYFSNDSAIDISLGYSFQKNTIQYEDGGGSFLERRVKEHYHRIIIRFGFLFN